MVSYDVSYIVAGRDRRGFQSDAALWVAADWRTGYNGSIASIEPEM